MSSENARYHTFWKRLAAGIIDELIFAPLYFCAYLLGGSSLLQVSLNFLVFILVAIYSIFLHGKYGQTLGKKVLNIKVCKVDDGGMIGFRSAFYRDSIWVVAQVAGFIYFLFISARAPKDPEAGATYEDFASNALFLWFLIELATMFLNAKRRALHDYLAGSVVVNLD